MKPSKYDIPIITLVLGLALNLVGIIAYLLSSEGSGITPLIPTFCGGVLVILGGLAFKTSLRPMAIHLALLFALLLAGGTTYMGIRELLDDQGNHRKLFAFLSTAMLCIAYLVIGVRSFMAARKLRRSAGRATRDAEAAGAIR